MIVYVTKLVVSILFLRYFAQFVSTKFVHKIFSSMIENNVKYLLMESTEDYKFKFENLIGYIQTKYEIHWDTQLFAITIL